GLHRRAVGNQDDLVIGHVGRGEGDVLLALFGDGQAVPEHVDALAVELGFLGAPVDGLELDLDVHAARGLARHVDVEADELVVLVAKAHGREIVVQPDDDFLGGGGAGLRGGVVALPAGREQRRGADQESSGQFFHIGSARGRKGREVAATKKSRTGDYIQSGGWRRRGAPRGARLSGRPAPGSWIWSAPSGSGCPPSRPPCRCGRATTW